MHLTTGAYLHIKVTTSHTVAYTTIGAAHYWCIFTHQSYNLTHWCIHHHWCILLLVHIHTSKLQPNPLVYTPLLVHIRTSKLQPHPLVYTPSLVHLTTGAYSHIKVTTSPTGVFTTIGASHYWCIFTHQSYNLTHWCIHHHWCISLLVHIHTSKLQPNPLVYTPLLVHLTTGAYSQIKVTT